MKSISLMCRRPDLTRAQFRTHYETVHAPLGERYFPFAKYVRNHVVEASGAAAWIDCVGEFWLSDPSAAANASEGEIAEIFRADRALFMGDRKCVSSTDEASVAGPARTVDAGGTPKLCLFVEAADTARTLGETLGAREGVDRVTLDLVREPAGWPGAALIWLWTKHELADLDLASLPAVMGALRVESEESRL